MPATASPAALAVRRVLSGERTVEQAAAALRAANPYSLQMEYDSAAQLGLDVEWRNRQIVGGADAAQYQAEISTYYAIQRAARTLHEVAARPAVATPAPRFVCPRCGETRDTTRAGHCDDCEG